MKQKINFGYLGKVWLLTILIPPFLIFLIIGNYHSAKFEEIVGLSPLIFFMVVCGLVLSFPSFLLIWLVFRWLMNTTINIRKKKMILGIVGVCFVWITFYIFDPYLLKAANFWVYLWPLCYSLTLVTAVFLFNPSSSISSQDSNTSSQSLIDESADL